MFLRAMAMHLAPIMGADSVVGNVSGGSSAKAMAYGAKGKFDGSISYATTRTDIQIALVSKPEVGYDALEPVAVLFKDLQSMFPHDDAPFKKLAEVFDYTRQLAGPMEIPEEIAHHRELSAEARLGATKQGRLHEEHPAPGALTINEN